MISTYDNMRFREVAEIIYAAANYTRTALASVRASCIVWERLTSNPPIREITATMIDEACRDALELGVPESRCDAHRVILLALLRKARGEKPVRIRKGVAPAPTEIDGSLRSYLYVLYKRHRLAGKSPNTTTNFDINIRHLSRSLGREAQLEDLSDDNILDAMNMLVEAGRSVNTANKCRTHLIALMTFFAKRGKLSTFPTVRPFKAPERTPRAWTRQQLAELFSACERQTGTICGLPAGKWWLCLHYYFWFSAERLDSALLLRLSDVDLESGWIHVAAEYRKGKTRDRDYQMKGRALDLLREFVALDSNRERLFPIDFCEGTLFNKYARLLRGCGLPADRRSKFHRMRRSALSWFKVAGGDPTALADHQSAETTRRSYLDPTICVAVQAADLLFDPHAVEVA